MTTFGGTTLTQWPMSIGLLGRVPPHEQARLRPFCELVEMRALSVLYEPGNPLTHVYFPQSGMVSLGLKPNQRVEAERLS